MKKPRIAIVGYGAMGKAIEQIALENEFEIAATYDIDDPITKDKKLDFDVAIDFTTPDVVMHNIKYLASKKKNIVIGTTGWYSQIEDVKKLAEKYQVGIVWGSNFSIGMQFFFRVIRRSAELLSVLNNFDIGITDIHHTRKKDAPSGTAISLAKLFVQNHPVYKDFSLNPIEVAQDKSKLQISSLRVGNVVGEHTVKIDSPFEEIEFTHSAKNRLGFASGVLEAASWIQNKKGFYGFEQVLESLWNEDK
jgi:4-hydroxy-tetrahydrodipicolinate reductase